MSLITTIKDHYTSIVKGKKYMNFLFEKDMKEYQKLNRNKNFMVEEKYLYPCIYDKTENAGSLGPYFWQDLWASTLITENNPKIHYDIGSRVDGFIAHLACQKKKIILIDIRPLGSNIDGVEFIQSNATNLENIESESIISLSALCSLEHFGLGRYGDPIDPNACFKAFDSIQRVMKKNGEIYISVPIGTEHLEFNAHRIFYPITIVERFNEMELLEFSVVNPDCTEIEYNVKIHKYDNELGERGLRFGLFHFKKI
jgi:Caenorhabditis protein of unknown function, DUF268